MRVLVDTNIILDFLLQREPFFQDAERLFQEIDSGFVVGYVTATTLTDIFYIARRHTRSVELARQAVSETLTVMAICSVNRIGEKLRLYAICQAYCYNSYLFINVLKELLPQLQKRWELRQKRPLPDSVRKSGS